MSSIFWTAVATSLAFFALGIAVGFVLLWVLSKQKPEQKTEPQKLSPLHMAGVTACRTIFADQWGKRHYKVVTSRGRQHTRWIKYREFTSDPQFEADLAYALRSIREELVTDVRSFCLPELPENKIFAGRFALESGPCFLLVAHDHENVSVTVEVI